MASSIDLIIPTYNRSALLAECLESVFQAAKPDGFEWRVVIVDNNSRDNTRAVVESFAEAHGNRVKYLFEGRQGKSAALNLGISESRAELIGMIDDDEQLDRAWFSVAAKTFSDPAVDYSGGPYLPLWRGDPPSWLPAHSLGVLGADERNSLPAGPAPFEGDTFFLRGGNAIIRRSVLQRTGGYSLALGRIGHDYGACEDHDMFDRLKRIGARGIFEPSLIIYHVVPPERLSRKYFRGWAFGRARSFAQLDRSHPQPVKYVGRVPRYMLGAALRAVLSYIRGSGAADRFTAELQWWDLAGFLCGAYIDARKQSPQ